MKLKFFSENVYEKLRKLHKIIIFSLLIIIIVIIIMNFNLYRNQDSEVEGDSNGDLQISSPGNSEAQQALTTFWPKVAEEIKKITSVRLFIYDSKVRRHLKFK